MSRPNFVRRYQKTLRDALYGKRRKCISKRIQFTLT